MRSILGKTGAPLL